MSVLSELSVLLSANYRIQLAVFALHTHRYREPSIIWNVQTFAERVRRSGVNVNEVAFWSDDGSVLIWYITILAMTININLWALVDWKKKLSKVEVAASPAFNVKWPDYDLEKPFF